METKSTKFKTKLGLFVLSGLLLFVIGIFYIGRQKHMFNPVFNINTTFKNISGLEVGNNVRFSGINVGTIDNIRIINDTTVKVDILVDRDVQQFIKKDCYVHIMSEGLIGDKIVSITQSSSNAETVKDGQFLSSEEPVETDAILSSLKVTGENAEVLSSQLADILYKINNGNGTLSRLIKDSTIANNLDQTIINLKAGTKGLGENMEAAKHNFLFRGYFRDKEKKEKEKAEKREEKKEEKAADKKEEKTNK